MDERKSPAPLPSKPTRATHLPQTVDIEKTLEGQHAPDDRFTLRAWAGYKLFCCLKCPFDTMYEENFDIHWAQRHIQPAPVRQPLTATLFHPNGRQILDRES